MNCSGFKLSCRMLLAGVLLGLASCGGPDDYVEVTEVAKRSPHRPAMKLDASIEERFRYALQSTQPSADSHQAHGSELASSFHWNTPEGWREEEPTSMRLVNLRFGEDLEGEFYVTRLSGGGGGMFANVNRWRAQMGLEPLSESEFDALPVKTFLNQDATFLDVEGTFGGMGGSTPKEDYRLMGVLLDSHGEGIFVKMVAPATLIEANKANFDLLLASLHVDEGHDHGSPQAPRASLPDGHPDVSGVEAKAVPVETPPSDSGDGMTWKVPEGWQKSGDRPMRLVTYTAASAECYITVLGGDGGGVLMNVNRWLNQFGQPTIDEEGLRALPTISMLGAPCALIETAGSYGGMSAEKTSGQALIGAIGLLNNRAVFIKMIGPVAEIAAERINFISFCESLQL